MASIDCKWHEIGTALDVDFNYLTGLQGQLGSNSVRLTSVINSWCTTTDNHTWSMVLEAVEGPLVNNRAKGGEIRRWLAQQPNLDVKSQAKPRNVITLLASIDAKWHEIGTALDVDFNFLTGLGGQLGSNSVRLTSVINSWCTATDNPTWFMILQAVEGPLVNNKAKGGEIRRWLAQQPQFNDYMENKYKKQ